MAKKSEVQELMEQAQTFRDDPLGFVYWAFPWKREGTALQDEEGPDDWQADILSTLGRELKKRRSNKEQMQAIQVAVSSGHGIGKTALVSFIIIWFLCTRVAPQVIVTANTQMQLSGKTWREVAKWHRLCYMSFLFKWTATRFYLIGRPEDWFAQAIPWSKERPEAFAGTHAEAVLMIFDEASAVEDIIWETAEGALTDPEAIWVCFGNPTRNQGRFFQCFHRYRHRWITRQIDSRTAKRTNKAQIQQWVDDYGEDSDFVRVRVRGVFPRSGATQLIPTELTEEARRRTPAGYEQDAVIIGVDIAYEGSDQSVICVRQGPAILSVKRFRGQDNHQMAFHVNEAWKEFDPDQVIMEHAGWGAGVRENLEKMGRDPLAVFTGRRALDDRQHANLRTEMWMKTRDWLEQGGCLPRNDQELADDLTGPMYAADNFNRFQLEKKRDMKQRGLASPDSADALALTFAVPVTQRKPRRNKAIEIRPPTMDELVKQQSFFDSEDARI